MNNQECKVRPQILNVHSDEPLFYPFRIKTSKCSGSCNNINNLYAKMCLPDVVKNLNVKAFNLMSRTNETRHIKWHETCKCKCRLDATVCNNKHRWNGDKCRCECKELIDKCACDQGFIWNPSNCECECDKSYVVGKYLDYEKCKCRKKLVDKLVGESTKIVEKAKIAEKKMKIHINVILAHCTLCYFQYFLQLTLELVLILFIPIGISKKIILPLKQRSNRLINGRSQTN